MFGEGLSSDQCVHDCDCAAANYRSQLSSGYSSEAMVDLSSIVGSLVSFSGSCRPLLSNLVSAAVDTDSQAALGALEVLLNILKCGDVMKHIEDDDVQRFAQQCVETLCRLRSRRGAAVDDSDAASDVPSGTISVSARLDVHQSAGSVAASQTGAHHGKAQEIEEMLVRCFVAMASSHLEVSLSSLLENKLPLTG